MDYATVMDVPPTVEPVSLDEAKKHLRVTNSDDDSYIDSLIKTAREEAETFTNRAFITQTWDLVLQGFLNSLCSDSTAPKFAGAFISFPKAPLQSVKSISYVDPNGDLQVWLKSNYTVDEKSIPGRVFPAYNGSYPSTLGHVNDVTIKFIAGYGNASSDVPNPIKQAILLMTGHFYDRREDTIVGAPISEIPHGAKSLLWPYRLEII